MSALSRVLTTAQKGKPLEKVEEGSDTAAVTAAMKCGSFKGLPDVVPLLREEFREYCTKAKKTPAQIEKIRSQVVSGLQAATLELKKEVKNDSGGVVGWLGKKVLSDTDSVHAQMLACMFDTCKEEWYYELENLVQLYLEGNDGGEFGDPVIKIGDPQIMKEMQSLVVQWRVWKKMNMKFDAKDAKYGDYLGFSETGGDTGTATMIPFDGYEWHPSPSGKYGGGGGGTAFSSMNMMNVAVPLTVLVLCILWLICVALGCVFGTVWSASRKTLVLSHGREEEDQHQRR